MIESFCASLQAELLDRKKRVTIVELSTEKVGSIDRFNKHKRRHKSLYVHTPTENENLYAPMFQLT